MNTTPSIGCSSASAKCGYTCYLIRRGLTLQRVPTDVPCVINSVNVDFLYESLIGSISLIAPRSQVVVNVLERTDELAYSVYHVSNTTSRGVSLAQFKRYGPRIARD